MIVENLLAVKTLANEFAKEAQVTILSDTKFEVQYVTSRGKTCPDRAIQFAQAAMERRWRVDCGGKAKVTVEVR